MSQSGSSGENPPSNSVSPDTEPTIVSTIHHAEPQKPERKSRFGRRVLFATGTLGVCAGAVALTPVAAKQVETYTQDQLNKHFQAGVEAGRQAILGELGQIEGVSLQGAIDVAELTRLAVLYIVFPLSNLYATVTSDLLGFFAAGVDEARTILGVVHITIGALDVLHNLLSTWQQNVAKLPKKLSDYATADILSAEAYLKALQRKIAEEHAASATPTTKP